MLVTHLFSNAAKFTRNLFLVPLWDRSWLFDSSSDYHPFVGVRLPVLSMFLFPQ